MEPKQTQPKQTPTQADPHHHGDVVVLAPKDWTDAEEALSKLAHVAADRRRPAARSDFSAGPRATEPSPGATLRAADLNSDPLPTNRHAPGGRTSRSIARFVGAACVGVAATLAWQSYGGSAKQMFANAAAQLGWLSLSATTDAPSGEEIAGELPSPPVVEASAPGAASAQAGSVAPTTPQVAASTAPAAPSLEMQQLEAMAHDLAAVRQSVEQLAAGQEQLARDIAKLETAGQDIRRRISALPPAAAPTAHRPVPPPQPAPRSSATLLPPAPPEPALQSSLPPALPEPPSRPPVPVR